MKERFIQFLCEHDAYEQFITYIVDPDCYGHSRDAIAKENYNLSVYISRMEGNESNLIMSAFNWVSASAKEKKANKQAKGIAWHNLHSEWQNICSQSNE